MYALNENINLYLTPSQLIANPPRRPYLRLGGMVKQGSFKRQPKVSPLLLCSLTIQRNSSTIYWILPALFREVRG